jgi:hypothetical protein
VRSECHPGDPVPTSNCCARCWRTRPRPARRRFRAAAPRQATRVSGPCRTSGENHRAPEIATASRPGDYAPTGNLRRVGLGGIRLPISPEETRSIFFTLFLLTRVKEPSVLYRKTIFVSRYTHRDRKTMKHDPMSYQPLTEATSDPGITCLTQARLRIMQNLVREWRCAKVGACGPLRRANQHSIRNSIRRTGESSGEDEKTQTYVLTRRSPPRSGVECARMQSLSELGRKALARKRSAMNQSRKTKGFSCHLPCRTISRRSGWR